MSLTDQINGVVTEEVDAGYISEAAMDQMCSFVIAENLSPEELEQVTESSDITAVVENKKNIVRLNKKAKFDRAYKVGILQCAAESKDKDYKKLRKLWKMEAVLYRKLERKYKSKAMARARESVRKVNRSSNPVIKSAGSRAATKAKTSKNLGGTNKFIHAGINKKK